MKKTFMRKKSVGIFLIVAMLLSVFLTPVTAARNYEDLKNHWSEGYVLRGYELGWIKGYEDGTIRPDENMTRAEFITLLASSIGFDIESENSTRFVDLSTEPWAEREILKAERLGLLDIAYPDNTLLPNEKITREEAAVLINHALMIKDLKDADESLKREATSSVKEFVKKRSELTNYSLSFNDKGEIENRFLYAVADLTDQGIIKGYEKDNTFRPKSPITRAEVITLLVKAYGESPIEIEKDKTEKTEVVKKDTNNTKPDEKDIRPVGSDFTVISEDGKFYLKDTSTDEIVKGPQFIKTSDNGYLIGEDSSLIKDFYKDGKKTYYVNGEKGLTKGWKQVGDALYYFSPADSRMYKDGIFSTGDGVHWFDKTGAVREGKRLGGTGKLNVFWPYPTSKELENNWLKGENLELRIRGQEIANFAASHEGVPFKWYGFDLTDGTGVYCVGNTYSAYKEFGIMIPGAKDAEIKKHRGYELTRVQYEMAEKFGGERYPMSFDAMWPGDLVFNYSPDFYLGYNHVMIYMGSNGNTPIVIHATLANGLVAEDARNMNRAIGRKFNKDFIRYNTEKNKGIKPYPVAK